MPEEGSKKRRISRADWTSMADFIDQEFQRRKGHRKSRDLEDQWREIDRQIAMKPDVRYKKDRNGKAIPERAWMPELELPGQAQTLEVLTADARRMMQPDSGSWFRAHAELTDDLMDSVREGILPVPGENDPPSLINQDNVDRVVEGWLTHFHSQYDFWGHIDLINAEAFKYGIGVGRVRLAKKSVFLDSARGVERVDTEIPVLFPRSIKNTYLDDSGVGTMNEGYVLGPAVIGYESKYLADVVLAASRGSSDPENPNGGWMPKNLAGIKDDDPKKTVEVLEYEGDLIVPRKSSRALFLPNVVITILRNVATEKTASRVVRCRFKKFPFCSYVPFPYHREHVDSPYASSPLMKGRPIQVGATEAFLRLMQSSAYNAEPALGYDSSDPAFTLNAGPKIHPGALIPSLEALRVYEIGDPQVLMHVYAAILQHYADVTGVNAPRLGAQTVSHTTAYAKDVEIARGTVRTVDYVRSTHHGPLTQFLAMEYEMARASMGRRRDRLWIEQYGGFVDVLRKGLPERAVFEVFGAGGPQEEAAKRQERRAALHEAIQMDILNIQQGNPPTIVVGEAIQQVLREGGWVNADAFLRTGDVPTGTKNAPPVEAADTGGPGTQIAALQALAGGGG